MGTQIDEPVLCKKVSFYIVPGRYTLNNPDSVELNKFPAHNTINLLSRHGHIGNFMSEEVELSSEEAERIIKSEILYLERTENE